MLHFIHLNLMKEIMTPTLPEPALNHGTFAPCNRYEGSVSKAYTEDQLVEYGKACREAALEEAAQICMKQDGVHDIIYADAIRSLK